MERDPLYIAAQIKLIRKAFGLTQSNLADAAGLTTRTIEKIESGRHRPEEQTLRSIARATGFDIKAFQKPSPEQEARMKAEMEKALRKTVLVPTVPMRTATEFLNDFGHRHGLRFDTSSVTSDEAMEIAATMGDWLRDLGDVWKDSYFSERLDYARGFADLCQQLEGHGHLCHMGSYSQRLRHKGRPDIVFSVAFVSIRPKEDADGERYALVELEGGWERADDSGIAWPPREGV